MTYGPDGMWYRAAQFGSQEECSEFLGRLKPALEARNKKQDDLLTISFRTSEGKNFVMALGYPELETITLAESLFERPPVTLSPNDLTYARQEVSNLRRGAGVSDTQAGAQALQRLQEMGLPEALAQSVAGNYNQDLTADSSRGPLPGSSVYKVDMRDVPRELRPELARMQEEVRRKARERARPFFIRFRSHIEEIMREEDFDPSMAVYLEQLRAMTPYLFVESAIHLFHAVYEPQKQDFPIPAQDLFIEFPESLDTPHGSIRALAVSCVNNPIAIAKVERKHPGLQGLMQLEEFKAKGLYRLQIIDDAMQFVTTESYDVDLAQWVYTQGCPTDTCVTEKRAGVEVIVQPCSDCRIRTEFWAAWIRTLLLIIDLEYAVNPEPQPWAPQIVAYDEEGTQRVGKGKNAHVINVTRKHEIEYRIVSFDVSKPASYPERTLQERHVDEEKRANWLMLASKDQIIYKRIAFNDIERHYTQHPRLLARCEQAGGKMTEMDGDVLREYRLEIRTDGTKAVVSKLVPFARYVPMLREKKLVIRKVIAGAYEQEDT